MNQLEIVEEDGGVVNYDILLTAVKEAESRIEAINKIKKIALKVTNAGDWVDMGGKPYLQSSGAEKIARLFGISWRIEEPLFEHEADGHFSYTYKGFFSFKSITIEAIGVRSSKDPFFRRYDKQGNPLPPTEIDKGDVKKAAYTNCIANGITRLLGIRNLTWEDLAEAGLKKESVSSVGYRKEITDMHQKVEDALTTLAGNDDAKKKEFLKQVTTFTDQKGVLHAGKELVEELSEKQAQAAYGKLKAIIEQQKKEGK